MIYQPGGATPRLHPADLGAEAWLHLWLLSIENVFPGVLAPGVARAGVGLGTAGCAPARAGGCLRRLGALQPPEGLSLHPVCKQPREAGGEGGDRGAAAAAGAAACAGADRSPGPGGLPRGRAGGAGVLPARRLHHPLPRQGRAQQPALPAVPVLAGLRGVLRPHLPAGGGSAPQLQPGSGGGAGGAAGAARPAPGPARPRPVRAAQPAALLRRLHAAAGRGARHPAPAAQRPGPHLRRGRPGRRAAHQPRLPLHGRGRALLDPAEHLLHPAGRLHAGGVPAEHGQGAGVPDHHGADGRPLHPPPHRGPMDRHPARLHVAAGRALVPAPLRGAAGVLLQAGFCPAAWRGQSVEIRIGGDVPMSLRVEPDSRNSGWLRWAHQSPPAHIPHGDQGKKGSWKAANPILWDGGGRGRACVASGFWGNLVSLQHCWGLFSGPSGTAGC